MKKKRLLLCLYAIIMATVLCFSSCGDDEKDDVVQNDPSKIDITMRPVRMKDILVIKGGASYVVDDPIDHTQHGKIIEKDLRLIIDISVLEFHKDNTVCCYDMHSKEYVDSVKKEKCPDGQYEYPDEWKVL